MDGELPSSYGVKPKYGLQDNYFDINMGEGCDIAVKIIDLSNDRCIRYIFVSEKFFNNNKSDTTRPVLS